MSTAGHRDALPRGRHALPREDVERSQRERLLRAMAEAAAERGYAAVTVADVLAGAGVSRATFYALFTSKADCFMSAFEAAAGYVLSPGLLERAAAAPDPHLALDHGIRAYLERVVAAPAMARLFLVETYAAGPEAVQRRAEFLGRQSEIITTLLGRTGEEDRFAGRAFLAAASALITETLMRDGVEALRDLHGPLLRLGDRMLLTG